MPYSIQGFGMQKYILACTGQDWGLNTPDKHIHTYRLRTCEHHLDKTLRWWFWVQTEDFLQYSGDTNPETQKQFDNFNLKLIRFD